MPATTEITEQLIREHVTRAVAEVFGTMLGRGTRLASAATQSPDLAPGTGMLPEPGVPQVVGTVGFIGDMNGLIYLYFPMPFAHLVSRHLLGMTEAELVEAGDETVNDAVGELTNMSVGTFKNGLADAGYECRLTIPSILRGSNFCIESINEARRYVYAFECDGHRVVTDILLESRE
jgi:chemotaxis protein CheX